MGEFFGGVFSMLAILVVFVDRSMSWADHSNSLQEACLACLEWPKTVANPIAMTAIQSALTWAFTPKQL
jgi:hypothetical protein